MEGIQKAQSECPVSDSDSSKGAGVELTWFPATEVESQPVCELVLDLHQPLCQLVVPSLPAHTQGQGAVSDTQKWSEKQTWYKPTLHVFDASTHHRPTAPVPQPIWDIPSATPELTLTPGG